MKFIGIDDKFHSRNDVLRECQYIRYWVILPRGTKKKYRTGTMYSSMIITKTKKRALKIQKKYNAPCIQMTMMTPFGRFVVKEWMFGNFKSWDDMWEQDMKLPEIDLTQLKEDNSPSNQDHQDNTDYGVLGG